jgi:hypothetical protein
MAHEHGPHICYCPSCNLEVEADASVQCNTLTCPECGTRMRAKETGEFRVSGNKMVAAGVVSGTPAKIKTTSVPCPVCDYPIPAPSYAGEQVRCAWCGSVSEAVAQEGVTIPTPVFTFFIGLGLGIVFGPAIWASTKGGSEWMAKKARERLGG